MTLSEDYCEAKRLLHMLRIANTFIERALKWPQVKADDGKALSAYAMFLAGCRNTMEDVKFFEEMDNPTNLRTVLYKLPYKINECWHVEANDLQENKGNRARFADLVNFINRKAKIAMDPLFGNIPEYRVTARVCTANSLIASHRVPK